MKCAARPREPPAAPAAPILVRGHGRHCAGVACRPRARAGVATTPRGAGRLSHALAKVCRPPAGGRVESSPPPPPQASARTHLLEVKRVGARPEAVALHGPVMPCQPPPAPTRARPSPTTTPTAPAQVFPTPPHAPNSPHRKRTPPPPQPN